MSGSAVTAAALNPKPERWGAFRAGNTDNRVRDTTPDMASINDSITNAICSVKRRDGMVMDVNDLHWTGGVSIDLTGRLISVTLTSGIPALLTETNPIDYLVTITVETNGSRTLSWDAYQLVVASIG